MKLSICWDACKLLSKLEFIPCFVCYCKGLLNGTSPFDWKYEKVFIGVSRYMLKSGEGCISGLTLGGGVAFNSFFLIESTFTFILDK